ncbi:D-amino acid aminotransferase [Clostridium sp. D53t1_180928_C8]|uniref:D-amino acid aminotransferase n=1 Tax=Clostridium sp. D53t1_180928_C8 TaxID=2787101 RepID=UPI0018AB18DB|nr:D-amino acid aminotransferase [Clostridium sp. D53t1_180928_C8]
MKNIGYYNGEVGLIEEIKIPMLDRGMYFGDGVYEATFAINNKIFALEDHLDRLYSSAALLDINIPNTRKEISDLLEELTSKVDSKVKFIYWQITRGTAPRKHIYPKEIKGNLYITITPFSDVRVADKKLKLITVEDTRFLHCNIKTLNLVPNIMASQKAEEAGCDEAIFHRGDIVTEASHSNVHIIKNGVFKTHPTDNLILPGISRKHIIDICRENNIKVDETPFTVKEMMEADEVIVTSSSKLIVPACEIDGVSVGGKATDIVRLLQEEYFKKVDLETK